MFMFESINKWLDGKRTIIAGVAGLGAFLTVVANQLADGFQTTDLQPILIAFSAAMTIFGFGGKLQKLIEAVGSK